jgi:zinc and cadmium transporter
MLWVWVMSVVALDGALGLAGGVIPDRLLVRHRPVLLGFGAGALVSAAIVDLVPEAYERGGATVAWWLLASIGVLALLDRLFHGSHESGRAVAYALLGSDAVHNFGDGMAIAAAFLSSIHLGIVTSAAVLLHELPEEVADYAILRAQHVGKRRSLIALALVQLTAGLGAAITLLGATLGGGHAIVLALAAGTFLYIALAELMPSVLGARADRGRALAGFAVGATLIALL